MSITEAVAAARRDIDARLAAGGDKGLNGAVKAELAKWFGEYPDLIRVVVPAKEAWKALGAEYERQGFTVEIGETNPSVALLIRPKV